MPLWFVRGLRRGAVTTRYPARPDASAAALPTPPAFRPQALTRDAADRLVAVCPSWALTRSGDVLTFDVGACTACGRCRAEAPGAAVASGEFELAATDRAHLVKRIPLLGGDVTANYHGEPA
jgi:formate hydrogenlyase subunit 6/NADH:ubiquinone oxidoreductase subunit I